MAIERIESFPRPHKFTVEEYLAFEEKSEFKHEFIDGVIYDWGDPYPGAPVHPDHVPGYPMPHLFTVEEYLAFEAESEFKHEFIDGIIYDMTGGTSNHSEIAINIIGNLFVKLRHTNCSLRTGDMRLKIREGLYVYPDVSAVCGEGEYEENRTVLLNPILAVEVISPTTANFDRSTKLRYYQSLSSLRGCLIVDQYGVQVDAYNRAAEGWRHQAYRSIADVIPLDMIGCALPLSEIYREIEFFAE